MPQSPVTSPHITPGSASLHHATQQHAAPPILPHQLHPLHATPRHAIPPHALIPPHQPAAMPQHAVQHHPMPHHPIHSCLPCHTSLAVSPVPISRQRLVCTTPWHTTLPHPRPPPHAVPHHAAPWYMDPMSQGYAKPCHAVPCHAVLCHAHYPWHACAPRHAPTCHTMQRNTVHHPPYVPFTRTGLQHHTNRTIRYRRKARHSLLSLPAPC